MNTWWAWRLWDVVVAAAPLAASLLAGALLVAWSRGDDEGTRPAGAATILGAGCALVQAVTWAIALFAPPALAAVWHWTVLGGGALAMGLAATPGRGLLIAPLRRWPVRIGLVAAPLAAFLIAHPNDVGQTPADALAYHLPAAQWFASGGAWHDLPWLLWTAQIPLGSSLWSSFASGAHVPIADPLVSWIGVNVAMVAWTGVVVADAVNGMESSPPRRLLAAGVGVAIVLGAYTAQSGFVDYTSGLLAVCLVSMVAAGPPAIPRLWMVALTAGALAECRPQGLLLACALAAATLALAPSRAWRDGVAPGRAAALIGSCIVAAKWWAIVWWRWGTPVVPILGARLGASPEVLNAEAVYRGQWPPAPLTHGLAFTLGWPGQADGVPAVTVAAWLLVALVALVAWRARRALVAAPWRIVALATALAPIGWAAFLASQNPTQAARMTVVAVPVSMAMGAAVVRAHAGADRLVQRWGAAALGIMLVVLVVQAPRAWNGEYVQGRIYPTFAGELAVQARRQLIAIGQPDACLLNQYGAPLAPRGLRYIGGLVPPWAGVPERLDSAADWIAWLRRHGARSVLTKTGWRLTDVWMPIGAPANENVAALDAWLEDCPGQLRSGDWFVCPIPSD